MANRPPVLPRFWSRVNKNGPIHPKYGRCWLWTAGKFNDGYGAISVGNKTIKAHRLSYEIHIGVIPPRTLVCHRCDNPLCVNPSHLFLATNRGNLADRDTKGRQAKGERQGSARLTSELVLKIREEYRFGSRRRGSTALARKYGVTQSTIYNVVTRKRWKYL